MSSSLLAGLDADQRAVAECLRGPVVVLAGAGTGKTRTLTHRIAHGVHTGVYAVDRVLALTFTRKAAAELQARLRGLGVGGVRATTFHGAALAQLGHFWPEVVGGVAPKVLGGKAALLAQAADSLGFRLGSETLRDVAGEIEWRKVTMRSLAEYAAGIESGNRVVPSGVTADQLMALHERYGALLDERRQIDFEDVLMLTCGMLEAEPRVARQVREQYRFFTVDEYQDVSPLQRALLTAWLGERTDVCVVGDASQTIYSFAGASSRFLLRFGTEFPGAREFRLETNYRSRASIIQAANRLMKDRPGALLLRPGRDEPFAVTARESVPAVEWFRTEHDEAAAVTSAIQRSLAEGVPASQIAILVRTNAQSAAFEAALADLGISSRVQGAKRFFDRAEVRQAILLIRGQAKAGDERPLFQVVSDMLRAVGWSATPPEGAAARERWQALNAILTMVDEQAASVTLQSFSDELVARSRAHHEPTIESVTISAVHSAKGLEWAEVYLAGMCEGLLPISYAESEAALDEERRLVYVAITRARDVLRISGSAGAGSRSRIPSRFLTEAGLPHAQTG